LTIYRIEKLIEYSKEEDLPKLALSEWLNGPGANFEELGSTVPSDVTVEYMNFKDDIAYVSFSKELKNANLGSSGEAALLEQIAMILQQFGYNETQILVEGEVLDTLLGHMDTSKPIKANKPEDYTLLKDN
jgi:spore germination protein GerM